MADEVTEFDYCHYCGTEFEGANLCPNFGDGGTHAGLSTADKIKAIEESGLLLVWDGCHKIYFLEDAAREAEARLMGYEEEDFYPATEVRKLIGDSCGLVFVSRWGHDNSDFDHDWNIEQCCQNIYKEAEVAA